MRQTDPVAERGIAAIHELRQENWRLRHDLQRAKDAKDAALTMLESEQKRNKIYQSEINKIRYQSDDYKGLAVMIAVVWIVFNWMVIYG